MHSSSDTSLSPSLPLTHTCTQSSESTEANAQGAMGQRPLPPLPESEILPEDEYQEIEEGNWERHINLLT